MASLPEQLTSTFHALWKVETGNRLKDKSILSKAISSFGVLMMAVQSSARPVASSSFLGVQLHWDQVTVAATAYDSNHFHPPPPTIQRAFVPCNKAHAFIVLLHCPDLDRRHPHTVWLAGFISSYRSFESTAIATLVIISSYIISCPKESVLSLNLLLLFLPCRGFWTLTHSLLSVLLFCLRQTFPPFPHVVSKRLFESTTTKVEIITKVCLSSFIMLPKTAHLVENILCTNSVFNRSIGLTLQTLFF